MIYPNIAYTMTMGRRMGMFMRTRRSFMDCCMDQDLISEWIVNDDGSSPEDLAFSKEQFPFLRITSATRMGQAAALNNLFRKVTTEYFYHNEDDWHYTRKGHFIRECLDIAHNHHRVRNVILRQWSPIFVKDGGLEYRVHLFDPFLKPLDSEKCAQNADRRWFGYSLNPGLQHLPTIRQLGEYDENIVSRKFDRSIARRYWQCGYLRANLSSRYIFHLGWDSPINWPGSNERV